jgi:hypothetical protein
MALTDDELKQIKEAAEAGLFAKGATGVGLGPIIDETTGVLGSEIVIAVLAPNTIPNLPGQINGVKTQLIKVASVEKAEPDEPGLCGEDRRDNTKYRAGLKRRKGGAAGALEGGNQVAVSWALNRVSSKKVVLKSERVTDGTGGFLATVQPKAGGPEKVVLVTNSHVVSHSLDDAEGDPPAVGRHVGQPSATTGSWCCPSSNDTIGYLYHKSRSDLCDGALIALVPGTEWVAQIHDGSRTWPPGSQARLLISNDAGSPAGVVRGEKNLTTDDLKSGDYVVQKRGIRTGVTYGRVRYVHMTTPEVSDDATDPDHPDKAKQTFPARTPREQVVIEPRQGSTVFNCTGDSGSAVLDGHGQVVGLIWAVSPDGKLSFADSIAGVRAAMLESGFLQSFTVATATTKDDVRKAPTTNIDGIVIEEGSDVGLQGAPTNPTDLQERVRQAQQGELWLAMYRRNEREIFRLVNHNKRVGARWQRNRGPTLLNQFLRASRDHEWRLPLDIDGVPVEQMVQGITGALARFGSAQLRADMDVLLPRMMTMGGRTLDELMSDPGTSDEAR